MRAVIGKTYSFSAAHRLPNVPVGHQCKNLHGHNYTLEVRATGEVHPVLGWVVDFAQIDAYAKAWVEQYDHKNLNDFLQNPTAENLAVDALEFLRDDTCLGSLGLAFTVRVWETPKCWAEVSG